MSATMNEVAATRLGKVMMGVPEGQTDIEGEAPARRTGGIAADRLKNLVDRIERLEEERKALTGDITDIYAEAKSAGFSVSALRAIIRLRKKDPAEIEEQDTLIEIYRHALGM